MLRCTHLGTAKLVLPAVILAAMVIVAVALHRDGRQPDIVPRATSAEALQAWSPPPRRNLPHVSYGTGRRFEGGRIRPHEFRWWNGGSLAGMDLRGLKFNYVILSGVDLSNTDLRSVPFRRAVLRGVDLSGANLAGAKLGGATYDRHTRWLEGFDPQAHGAKLKE